MGRCMLLLLVAVVGVGADSGSDTDAERAKNRRDREKAWEILFRPYASAELVELAPRQGFEHQTRQVLAMPEGSWAFPVLVDKASGELIYDWTWRSRRESIMGGLRSITPAPLGQSIRDWQGASILCQGMAPDGSVWLAFTGSDHLIAVAHQRSPFAPRDYTVRTDLPFPHPDVAAAFRDQLHALAKIRPNVPGGNGPALLSEEVVAGLDRFDLGTGEPDFPTPMEKRVEVARQVWKLGAEMLNAAFERWQDPAYVTDYGCIYSPDGQAPTPVAYSTAVWRDVALPPQVQKRIATLKDMKEGPERVKLRREANRLLLDFLVPSAGVASTLVPGAVPAKLIPHLSDFSLTGTSGFEIRIGKSEDDQPFGGISVWYARPFRTTATPHCICAVSYAGQMTWLLRSSLPDEP